MNIQEHIEQAKEWSKGHTFDETSMGWRVTSLALAEEVERLQSKLEAAERSLGIQANWAGDLEKENLRLEAQAAKLAEALQMLYNAAPECLGCQDFHHSKKDRHEGFECGPLDRYNAALKQASDTLAAYRDGEP